MGTSVTPRHLAMEAGGDARSDDRSQSLLQQEYRPPKRKRLSHPGPSHVSAAPSVVSRPRAFGIATRDGVVGHLHAGAPRAKKSTSSSAISQSAAGSSRSQPAQAPLLSPAHDVGLHTSQAYHGRRLHNTDSHLPGHQNITTVQHQSSADPVVGSSGHGSGVMSIAYAQPDSDEIFSPATSSPSLSPVTTDQIFNSSLQHRLLCNALPAQSGDINGQSHLQGSSQSSSPQLSQPPSVPQHFITVGGHTPYSYSLVLSHHPIHDLSGQAHIDPSNVDAVASGPETQAIPAHQLFGNQIQHPTANGEGNTHIHHHHQTQQPIFQAHPQQHNFESVSSSLPIASLPTLSIAGASYNQHFAQGGGSHYSHDKANTDFSTDSYLLTTTMGGGQYIPPHDEFVHSLGHHPQNTSYNISSYAVGVDEAADSRAPPEAPIIHPYREIPDGSKVNWPSEAHNVDANVYGGDGSGVTSDQVSDVSGDGESNAIVLRENTENSDVHSNKKSTKASNSKTRGAFNNEKRKQTAETRKSKACVRCRTQKMRCVSDSADPRGPCVGCQGFSKTSKKTIHLVPCFRGKITDVVLYRSGGLQLTSRWTGTEMKDVSDRINPNDIRTFEFTLGLCKMPIVVKAVAFQPQQGDITARFWIVRDNDHDVRRKKELTSYCLANIYQTAVDFEKYIIDNAISAMMQQRTGPVQLAGQSQPFRGVIERTYIAALRHYFELEAKDAESKSAIKEVSEERKLLGNLFILWFATRHTTGSSWICGDETLDMKPETHDQTYPLFGRVSVPRMILAQFDSITHKRILSKYGKDVLKSLEILISKNQPCLWFTIYLCLFILLREASWMSEDRYRHARNNYGKKVRYSIPAFVEELQEGCNNLLQHWHYYNCKPWPDPAAPWDRHKSFLAELSSEQYDLVMETMVDRAVQKQLDVWRRYKKENGRVQRPSAPDQGSHETAYQGSQSHYDWDHPFYWVSQLFEEQWEAHPTYQREYPDGI